MTQPRQPKGIPSGGRFAGVQHAEPNLSTTERFNFHHRPPEAVLEVHRLLGAGEVTQAGVGQLWWQQNATFEELPPNTPLHTGQPTLRHDEHPTDGAIAPPPTQLDEDTNITQWPLLLRDNGKLWVIDGHHRLTAAARRHQPLTTLVVDLDKQRAAVASSPPIPEPEPGYELLDHISEGHIFENDAFAESAEIVDEDDDCDGVETVTIDQLIEWHDNIHRLGLADHRH